MIFNRQKFLLALLEKWGGVLSRTMMQKLLFLASMYQSEDKKSYHFVPYKYGCFSFNSYSDKRKLVEKQILQDTEDWRLSDNQGGFYFMLPDEEKNILNNIKLEFGALSREELLHYHYLNYPYFAINSEILDEVLTESEISKIQSARPQGKVNAIYTIGYQEKSLEEYINLLILEDVKILLDVRKNPISRKYGFSKKTLKNAIESMGMEYRHIPELGISGEKRTNLSTLDDYNRLFDIYEKEVLNNSSDLLEKIYKLLVDYHRVGLTCFEKSSENCHRNRIAKAIVQNFNQELLIINL